MVKVELSERLPLGADASWAFLMSPAIQSRWLGANASIPPTAGSGAAIPWEIGKWRTGIVETIEDRLLELTLKPPLEWQARHGRTTTVRIDLSADPNDGAAVVTINEAGFDGLGGQSDPVAAAKESERRWAQALGKLKSAASLARKRSQNVRQAVLVIHGIGEQTPGQTVRGLVQAAAEPPERKSVRSKPDRISKTFELRRWQLQGSQFRPTTDFFEVYWADKVRDTKLSHVLAWLRRVLLRPPQSVPASLRPMWWSVWLALIAAAIAVVSFLPGLDFAEDARWVSFALSVVLGVISGFMVNSVGDAARYLWPHPENVAVRDSIRRSGFDLLHDVHDSGRYHRVIVVGHSLGSVIAHDIISHFWIASHLKHRDPVSVQNSQSARLEQLLQGGGERPGNEDDGSAWSVWTEIRRNTQPWLITDLVTAGSPLTHASLLLAESETALEGMFERRELAACPPRPIDDFWFNRSYIDELGRRRTFRFLAHNAPFAVTRWTNLYFPVRLGFFGDLVGGPLRDVFGPWIVDVPVSWGADRWRGQTLLAHSLYWRLPSNDDTRAWEHIDALRTALDLNRRQELEALANAMPREAWL